MSLRTRTPAPLTVGPTPLLVTYERAAQILGGEGLNGNGKPVTVRHVERLVAAGELKAVGQSKARRIVYQSLLEYIEREASNG